MMGVDLVVHLSNRLGCPVDELAVFLRDDPLRLVQAERMIMRLSEQGVGFASHDDYESPYVVYAGLLPFDSPMVRPLRVIRLKGMSIHLPISPEEGHRYPSYSPSDPEEELRYPGLPWWNGGAGRLYPLENIYYYHTLKEGDKDSRSLTNLFASMSI
ncbi:hypothetical protein AAVH_11479 [Aphelenchoides avenae]|nr:hypothetical protein AAVH_11479 [Aphelenchus avenae]